MHIIVEDIEGLVGEGAVVEEKMARHLAPNRSVCCMPVTYPTRGGVHGFHKVMFGRGHVISPVYAAHVARLTLMLDQGQHLLHWRAKVTRCNWDIELHSDNFRNISGSLRLAGDSSQGIPTCGVSPEGQFNMSQLTEDMLLNDRTWIIGGRARANVQQPGCYAFSLYGNAPGFKVIWVALSQE
jgi:hypothetical protein